MTFVHLETKCVAIINTLCMYFDRYKTFVNESEDEVVIREFIVANFITLGNTY